MHSVYSFAVGHYPYVELVSHTTHRGHVIVTRGQALASDKWLHIRERGELKLCLWLDRVKAQAICRRVQQEHPKAKVKFAVLSIGNAAIMEHWLEDEG